MRVTVTQRAWWEYGIRSNVEATRRPGYLGRIVFHRRTAHASLRHGDTRRFNPGSACDSVPNPASGSRFWSQVLAVFLLDSPAAPANGASLGRSWPLTAPYPSRRRIRRRRCDSTWERRLPMRFGPAQTKWTQSARSFVGALLVCHAPRPTPHAPPQLPGIRADQAIRAPAGRTQARGALFS